MNGQGPLGHIVKDLNEQAHYVTEFHNDLKARLHSAAEMFLSDNKKDEECPADWETKENVCDVFEIMKPRFLVYAPFVEMCNNVENIITLMKCDANVKQHVDSLEKHMMNEMSSTNNRNLPTTFNALLALPFQHILRYLINFILY